MIDDYKRIYFLKCLERTSMKKRPLPDFTQLVMMVVVQN